MPTTTGLEPRIRLVQFTAVAAPRARTSVSKRWLKPCRSAPAQKARPSPTIRIAPIASSSFQALIWPAISPAITSVQAFSFSGRLSRITPTRPCVSVRICSCAIIGSRLHRNLPARNL